jgi:oxalyl-CoA decarboxylase
VANTEEERTSPDGETDIAAAKEPDMTTTDTTTEEALVAAGLQQEPGELTDGFHLLVDALKLNGVEVIYGLVGIPITDLARLAQASGIRYIGFRHEQSAGNAAAAAGFLTKKPGICLTVSAPGFLNGLPALAAATVNCFPMIQISGSSERHLVDLQRGEYEELDQLAAARPFAKAAYRIDRAEDIGRGVARAIRTAVSGRPGGVYLDIPGAVLAEAMDAAAGAKSLWPLTDPAPRQLPAPEAVDRALSLLAGAKRPLVVLGKGAAYAQADDEIRAFLESTGIPYLPMSMAKGLLPDDHPQSVAAARSIALAKADVVMLVGARLNWLLGHGEAPQWNPDAKFIQVDIEATELDSNQPIAAPLVGDIGSVVAALAERAKPGQVTAPAAWLEELKARKDRNLASMQKRLTDDPHPMRFYSALRAVREVLADRPDVYLVNEGANALDITRNVIDMKLPRHRLDSGTWGVMGIGQGYAIAAAVETGAPVVAIEGDSAFGFSGMELETICRYDLPVTVVVLNNGGVYRGDEVTSTSADPAPTRLDPKAHHERLIEAFGGAGYHATTPQEVADALGKAIASSRPALVDCVLDPGAGTESGHIAHLNPKSAVTANGTPAK